MSERSGRSATVTESCHRAAMELDGILRPTSYRNAHRTVRCDCGSLAEVRWDNEADDDHAEPQWMAKNITCRSATCRRQGRTDDDA